MSAYRGYAICHSIFDNLYRVQKGGFHIGTYTSAQEAHKGIDELEGVQFVDVQHETAYGSTMRFSRQIRVF